MTPTDKLGPTGELERAGLNEAEIFRLADEYIALHLGEGLGEFVEWAPTQTARR